jgi:hypothetical protein
LIEAFARLAHHWPSHPQRSSIRLGLAWPGDCFLGRDVDATTPELLRDEVRIELLLETVPL